MTLPWDGSPSASPSAPSPPSSLLFLALPPVVLVCVHGNQLFYTSALCYLAMKPSAVFTPCQSDYLPPPTAPSLPRTTKGEFSLLISLWIPKPRRRLPGIGPMFFLADLVPGLPDRHHPGHHRPFSRSGFARCTARANRRTLCGESSQLPRIVPPWGPRHTPCGGRCVVDDGSQKLRRIELTVRPVEHSEVLHAKRYTSHPHTETSPSPRTL